MYSNPGTPVGTHNKDFGAVLQINLLRWSLGEENNLETGAAFVQICSLFHAPRQSKMGSKTVALFLFP